MIGLAEVNSALNLIFLPPRGNLARRIGVLGEEILRKRALDGAPPLRKIHWFKIRQKSAESNFTVITKQAGGKEGVLRQGGLTNGGDRIRLVFHRLRWRVVVDQLAT